MRALRYGSILPVLLLLAAPVLAAPPKVPGPRVVAVNEVFEVEFEEDAKGPAVLKNPYALADVFVRQAVPSRKGVVAYIVQPKKPGAYRFTLWTKGDVVGDELPVVYYDFVTSGEPLPPGPGPGPTPPTPPVPPAPQGFRVIFVYETSQALTPAMQQVMFGEKVRTYLDARAKGWRRWDKDVDARNEKDADVKALWEAARPKVTVVPCVIVAVGGKAEIIPFPTSEAEALTILKKYGGE